MWYRTTDLWLPNEAIATVLRSYKITLVYEWLSNPRTSVFSISVIPKAADLNKRHMSRKSTEMCGKYTEKYFC